MNKSVTQKLEELGIYESIKHLYRGINIFEDSLISVTNKPVIDMDLLLKSIVKFYRGKLMQARELQYSDKQNSKNDTTSGQYQNNSLNQESSTHITTESDKQQSSKDRYSKPKPLTREPQVIYSSTPRTLNLAKSKPKLNPLNSPPPQIFQEKSNYENLLAKSSKDDQNQIHRSNDQKSFPRKDMNSLSKLLPSLQPQENKTNKITNKSKNLQSLDESMTPSADNKSEMKNKVPVDINKIYDILKVEIKLPIFSKRDNRSIFIEKFYSELLAMNSEIKSTISRFKNNYQTFIKSKDETSL